MIRAARGINWFAEAQSTVIRPDAIKIEDVAVDPDAPTLEEQEKVDSDNLEINKKYQEDINEYIETKTKELDTQLEEIDLGQLRLLAQIETSTIMPMNIFAKEVQDQRVWRSVYTDKTYKQRAFDSIEDFRQADEYIQEQLTAAYAKLETGIDEVKN